MRWLLVVLVIYLPCIRKGTVEFPLEELVADISQFFTFGGTTGQLGHDALVASILFIWLQNGTITPRMCMTSQQGFSSLVGTSHLLGEIDKVIIVPTTDFAMGRSLFAALSRSLLIGCKFLAILYCCNRNKVKGMQKEESDAHPHSNDWIYEVSLHSLTRKLATLVPRALPAIGRIVILRPSVVVEDSCCSSSSGILKVDVGSGLS